MGLACGVTTLRSNVDMQHFATDKAELLMIIRDLKVCMLDNHGDAYMDIATAMAESNFDDTLASKSVASFNYHKEDLYVRMSAHIVPSLEQF
jgi:hypothetical protein